MTIGLLDRYGQSTKQKENITVYRKHSVFNNTVMLLNSFHDHKTQSVFTLMFLQEIVMLLQIPIKVDGGSSGNFEDELGKHEHWRKYGWAPQEDYMNNQWYVDHFSGDFGKRRHSEPLTVSTFDFFALPDSYFDNYYTKVSTFYNHKENRNSE